VLALLSVSAVSCLTVATTMSEAGAADPASGGSRVLQSVDVSLAPDSTVTGITGTTVSTTSGAEDSETKSTTYTPSDVVDKLPVRVLTAYHTAKGSGTDLSDLKGYTGKVEIDLTVQNTTVEPQTVSYDAGGSSRSQAALVGVPLTVVASADLGDTPSSSVVTDASGDQTVTNGVLSQSGKDSHVQWATILAPPQLSPTATLSLVVDAKKFDPPAFDLSVQPGLVTDPSIGALIDSTFNPKSSSELQLESRTVDLITDVNNVLDRASSTISNVRKTLESSSATLGSKTVGDLKASAAGVATSMKGLQSTTKSLGQDLSTSLKSTQSTALQQLQQTVETVGKMLGDTSVKPSVAKVKGSGCTTTVSAPGKSDGVYGNLMQVVGQLSGYASASSECKTAIQQSLLKSVGPSDRADCSGDTSVTCSLYAVKDQLANQTAALIDASNKAISDYNKGLDLNDLVTDADDLSTAVNTVEQKARSLDGSIDLLPQSLSDIRASLATVSQDLDQLSGAIDAVHADAKDGYTEETSMEEQNTALAKALCDVKGGDTAEPGKLTAADDERLRSYLTATSCPDADGNTTPLDPPAGYSSPMEQRLSDQAAQWQKVESETDTSDSAQAISQALTAVRAAIGQRTADGSGDSVYDKIKNIEDELNSSKPDLLGGKLHALADSIQDLENAREKLVATDNDGDPTGTGLVYTIQGQQADLLKTLSDALDNLSSNADKDVAGTVRGKVQDITHQSSTSSDALGQMFENSTKGLNSAAGAIAANGKQTVSKQIGVIGRQRAAASNQVAKNVEAGLASISKGVSSSTRDMGAASAILGRDLADVLADLGNRKVHGSGLLGSMTTSSAAAQSADYQLALATGKTTAYANVRGEDVNSIYLRQAETDAALQLQADMPAFDLNLAPGTTHRTVYSYHVEGSK